ARARCRGLVPFPLGSIHRLGVQRLGGLGKLVFHFALPASGRVLRRLLSVAPFALRCLLVLAGLRVAVPRLAGWRIVLRAFVVTRLALCAVAATRLFLR